jgi:DNA-binding CsgD family transcriptional regulator
VGSGIDGRRFDQWAQRLARKLSRDGSAELEDPTRLAVGQLPPAVATPAVAGGTCAYQDLPAAAAGGQDQGGAQTMGICGWEYPPAVPASNGAPPPVRTGRSARRHRAQPLSAREQEIAALIAQGLRDREIAEALVLSEHTVHAHVRNLLAKLGVASRTQIAAWVATGAPDKQAEQ